MGSSYLFTKSLGGFPGSVCFKYLALSWRKRRRGGGKSLGNSNGKVERTYFRVGWRFNIDLDQPVRSQALLKIEHKTSRWIVQDWTSTRSTSSAVVLAAQLFYEAKDNNKRKMYVSLRQLWVSPDRDQHSTLKAKWCIHQACVSHVRSSWRTHAANSPGWYPRGQRYDTSYRHQLLTRATCNTGTYVRSIFSPSIFLWRTRLLNSGTTKIAGI